MRKAIFLCLCVLATQTSYATFLDGENASKDVLANIYSFLGNNDMRNVATTSRQTRYNLEISRNITGLQALRRTYQTAEAKRSLILNADNIDKLGLYVDAFGYHIFDLLSKQELMELLKILPSNILNTWSQKISMTRRINGLLGTESWDEIKKLLSVYIKSDFFQGNKAFCTKYFSNEDIWIRFHKRVRLG